MSSKLRFIHGVMGSSKTLRLLSTAHDFFEKGIPFLIFKPSIDTRDGENKVSSRAGLERECIMIDSTVNLFKVINDFNHIKMANLEPQLKWVLIDECQFLTEEQVEQLSEVVDILNIDVICYGLRTDFKSKSFPASKRLFELSDDIEEIKTMCRCGRRASINARFDTENNIITEGNQVMVGGDDLYRPICRKCWKELIRGSKK